MSAGTVAHAYVITDRGKMGSAPLGYGHEALRAQESVPADATTLAVSLDRLMAPMKDRARQAKRDATSAPGRPTKGPAGYPEVRCGTVSCYDCEGQRLTETKKATPKQMLSGEMNAALEQRPDLRLVKLADAAHDNRTHLGESAPQADSSTDLVDFFHAAEQLNAATDAAYGDNHLRGPAQCEKYRHLLRNEPGRVERMIRGLRYLQRPAPTAATDSGSAALLSPHSAPAQLRCGGTVQTADSVSRSGGRVQFRMTFWYERRI